MKEYINLWITDLLNRSPLDIKGISSAQGICNRPGPSGMITAKVKISLGPSDRIIVINEVKGEDRKTLEMHNFDEQIIFGALDVLLTAKLHPYRTFELRILEVEIHEITTVPIAFRIAAADAITKIMRSW
ncbi:MAG: hypothetical protein OEZ02_05805 [Anaerolineae bacterium]|nr:hypothetical protein [Anaerolineae bacterium]